VQVVSRLSRRWTEARFAIAVRPWFQAVLVEIPGLMEVDCPHPALVVEAEAWLMRSLLRCKRERRRSAGVVRISLPLTVY
jgi:hypothetical protein